MATSAITLSGTIINYPKDSLAIYTISNPITNEDVLVTKAPLDTNGYFKFHFEAKHLQSYHIPLGTRTAQVTLAPEQQLELILPAYTPLSTAQRLNPFFEKEVVLLYNKTQKDINYYLTEIEIRQTLWLKTIIESSTPEATALHIRDSIATYRATLPYPYAKHYLDTKVAFFWRMSAPMQQDIIKDSLLRHQAPQLYNPNYMALLQQEFSQAFVASDGLFYSVVSQAILNGKLPTNFVEQIAKIHKISHKSTAILLCILGFYEAAQRAPEYEQNLIPLMSTLALQIEDSTLKQLCLSTQNKMKTLCIGQPAPYYELRTPRGKKVPTALKRKYVLLAFVNTNIFNCQRHLRLLEKYKAEFKRDLEVVVVACYQDQDEIERFLARNTYDKLYFTLSDNEEQLLKDYEISGLPQYYLIAPNGTLLYSPLSSPEEDMLEQLKAVIGEK